MPNRHDLNSSLIINDGEHPKQAAASDEEFLRGTKVHREVCEIIPVHRKVGLKRDSPTNLL